MDISLLLSSVAEWNIQRLENPDALIDFRKAILSGADLCNADLSKAKLRYAILNGADLCNADLSWADLCNADLNGADLTDAKLRRAKLSGADLYDTIF